MRTLDIDECADFLKVDRNTALKLAGAGELPGARIGRAWVFLEDEIVAYLRDNIRRQMRERQAKAAVFDELENCSVGAEPMMVSVEPGKRGRKKNPRPDLSSLLPELVGQGAAPKVAVPA